MRCPALLLLFALVAPAAVFAAPAPPEAIAFEKLVAVADSIPDGTRLSLEVQLDLQWGLHTSTRKPGFTQLKLSAPDGRGRSFENASLRVNDPLVDTLLARKDATPARIVAVKHSDDVGMAWLIIESIELLPPPPAAPVEGGVSIALNTRVRLSTTSDGNTLQTPLILSPQVGGPGMVDADGTAFGGIAVPWAGTRQIEIEVAGQWVPLTLYAAGAW